MNCLNCNKLTKNPKFCSLSCSVITQRKNAPRKIKPIIYCHNCQSIVKLKHGKKFCSKSCSATYNNKLKRRIINCKQCGKLFQPKRKKTTYCSKICGYTVQKGSIKVGLRSNTPQTIRRYILSSRKHQCQICLNTIWNSLPIPLEVDHIDGNYLNNTEDNLRLICSNCHRQTPTFGSKNRGNGRHLRRQRYAEGKSR